MHTVLHALSAALLLMLASLTAQAAELPSANEIQSSARQYYDTKGEWAGQFVIQQFLRSRIEALGPDHFIAHLEYQWAFRLMPDKTGTDERAFEFRFANGRWQVVSMGGNHSGKL